MMNRKQRSQIRQLTLQRETIAQLKPRDLVHVQGAVMLSPPFCIPPPVTEPM